MTRFSGNRSVLLCVSDSLGGQWASGVSDSRAQVGLVAGSKLSLNVEASEGAMFGLAVGGESVAAAEWNDYGRFEVIVTSSFLPRLSLHIAVRHSRSGDTVIGMARSCRRFVGNRLRGRCGRERERES